MLEQTIIHLSAALAAAYLLWTALSPKRKRGCASGCGSCGTPAPAPQSSTRSVTLTINQAAGRG